MSLQWVQPYIVLDGSVGNGKTLTLTAWYVCNKLRNFTYLVNLPLTAEDICKSFAPVSAKIHQVIYLSYLGEVDMPADIK